MDQQLLTKPVKNQMLQQLAEGKINLHQLVSRRLLDLQKPIQELMLSAPTGFKIQTLLAYQRGDSKWCGLYDQTTPRQLAQVLRFDIEEFCQAYQLGYQVSHSSGSVRMDLDSLFGIRSKPARSTVVNPPKPHAFGKIQPSHSRPTARRTTPKPKPIRSPRPPKPVKPERDLQAEKQRCHELGIEIRQLRQQLNWTIVDCCQYLDVRYKTFLNAQAGKGAALATAEQIRQGLQQALDQGRAKPARPPKKVKLKRDRQAERLKCRELALHVCQLRQQLNWTAVAICRELKISTKTLSYAEIGEKVSLQTADHIVQGLQRLIDEGRAIPPKPIKPQRDWQAERLKCQELAPQIKHLRNQLRWTQKYTATQVGLSPYTICQAERGISISASTAQSIKDQLQQALDEGKGLPDHQPIPPKPPKSVKPQRDRRAERAERTRVATDIRRLRQQLNWTLEDVAMRVGCTGSYVSLIERDMGGSLTLVQHIRDQLQRALDAGQAKPARQPKPAKAIKPERDLQAEQLERQRLAPQVCQLRQQLHWTAVGTARYLEISPNTLNNAEAGIKVMPSTMQSIVQRLQEALDKGLAQTPQSAEDAQRERLELGCQIAEIRQEIGWSAVGVCRYLNVGLSTLERVELGKGSTVETARRILQGLQQIRDQGILESAMLGKSRQTLAQPKDLADRAALQAWLSHTKHLGQLSGLNTRQVLTVDDAVVVITISPLAQMAEVAD